MALNGLAGIAIIERKFSEAVCLYKEAMSLVEEHSEDFRLDPLLNIHLHHNLAEILPLSANCSKKPSSEGQQSLERSAKRQKLNKNDHSFCSVAREVNDRRTNFSENGFDGEGESDSEASLKTACENLKQKYLSVFSSKLSLAQLDFKKSYMQVCYLYRVPCLRSFDMTVKVCACSIIWRATLLIYKLIVNVLMTNDISYIYSMKSVFFSLYFQNHKYSYVFTEGYPSSRSILFKTVCES